MTRPQPPSAEQIIAALHAHDGVLKHAADTLGISVHVLKSQVARDPAVAAALAGIRSRQEAGRQEQVRRFAQALLEAKGVIVHAADALGCPVDAVRWRIKHDPEVAAAYAQATAQYPGQARAPAAHDPAAIIGALRAHDGVLKHAADALGMSVHVLKSHVAYDPAIAAVLAELRSRQEEARQERVRRVAQALLEAKGVLAHAARALDCSVENVSTYIRRYPEVAAAYAQATAQHPGLAYAGGQYDPQVVAQALLAAKGIKAQAARLAGCSRSTIDRYCAQYPEVAAALTEGRATFLDNAESALSRAVDKEAPWAVTFTLKTLGRERGYSERTEQVQVEDDEGDRLAALQTAIERSFGSTTQ